jgi:Ran GTPase-activating protein (RanGAP) involved in mRNA processing and transport
MLDLTGTDPKVDGLTAIVTALQDNHGLQTLMLRGIQVKPEVVGALADALQGNATLRTLDLQQVGTTDAEAFALAAAFAAHPSLTSLNLAEADLTDAGISALADAVRRNTSIVALDVLHNRTTDEGMAALAAAVTASTLRDLSAGASSVTAVGLQSMAEILADNPSLTALRLAALDIKDEGTVALAESLRRNTVVRTLALRNLGWYRTTGQRVWGDVAPDPGIRTRSIVEPAFTEWHTNEIEKTKKDWRAEKQALVDQQAASHRRRIRSGPPLTSKRLTALKNRLTMLKTDKTANTRRAQMAPLLAKLDFGVKRQRDTGPIALAETLKENGTITALELHNYQITTAAARALREMLARNTALTSLDLADNYIDREAIVELLPALRSNSTLTHLGLRHNLLRDPGAQAIAATLQRNTALRSVDLRDNLLTDKSCVSLATAVAAHPGVVLDLRDNFIPTTVWQDPTVRSLLSEARLFMDEDD